MDLNKALRDLYAERQRLKHIITTLQELQQTTPPHRHGGDLAELEPVTEQRKRAGRVTNHRASQPAPEPGVSSSGHRKWHHHGL